MGVGSAGTLLLAYPAPHELLEAVITQHVEVLTAGGNPEEFLALLHGFVVADSESKRLFA